MIDPALESSRLADYAMLIDLLGRLPRSHDEVKTLHNFVGVLKSICPARRVLYLSMNLNVPGKLHAWPPLTDDDLSGARQRLSTFDGDYATIPDSNGFCLRVEYDGVKLGILEVMQIEVPEKLDHYLNLTLLTRGVLGLTIAENRKFTEIINLKQLLFQAQKMAAIGTLAGGVAHNFNNILAIIIGNTELLLSGMTRNPKNSLENILKAGFRGRDLVQLLLTFSRGEELQREFFNPALILREVLQILYRTTTSSIEIQLEVPDSNLLVHIHPNQLHQVVLNLCNNALHAMKESGGRLTVGLHQTKLEEQQAKPMEVAAGSYLVITVQDTGQGIAPDIRERIFEPFFTTKEVNEGTGLGLAMVHGAVRDWGGCVQVESTPGLGSTFMVYIPALDPTTIGAETVAENQTHAVTGKGRLLLVDDDPELMQVTSDLLTGLGYQVAGFTNSLEALINFQKSPNAFDAVITDEVMPGMVGHILAENILQLRPELPIFLCTGFSENFNRERAASMGLAGSFLKPLTLAELSNTLSKKLSTSAKI